jgi:hypothetical protein
MNRIVFRIAGLLTALLTLTAGRAGATTLTDSQIFSQFNAVIFNNFGASSEIEGRTVVGGDVTGGSDFEIHSGSAASSFGALSVYGNVTASGASFNIDNGGNVVQRCHHLQCQTEQQRSDDIRRQHVVVLRGILGDVQPRWRDVGDHQRQRR